MNLITEAFSVAAAVVLSIGGGGAIVFALSNWLGKVWANQLMAKDRARYEAELEEIRAKLTSDNARALSRLESELGIFQEKHLGLHNDKVNAYRLGIDLVTSILGDLDRHGAGTLAADQAAEVFHNFNKNRMRLYGYLAMLAPQEVMDALDEYIDHLLAILNGEIAYDWQQVRRRGLSLLREIRNDLGVENPNIEYRGTR